MNYIDMIKKDLIFLDEAASTRQELFSEIASKLKQAGYVKDSYEKALNQREDSFPTGVVFPGISVMLPHAEPENIVKPFMAIVKNSKPIKVLQMGYNEPEDATAMFFLGITDSSQQVGLLQIFMDLLQDADFVSAFKEEQDSQRMYKLFTEAFQKRTQKG